MKIKKLKLENHEVLKNLELDFTNSEGEAVDTVILAGENGTGKTTILRLLHELAASDLPALSPAIQASISIHKELRDELTNLASEESSWPPKFTYVAPREEDGIVDFAEATIVGGRGAWSFCDHLGQELVPYGNAYELLNWGLKSIFSQTEINFLSAPVANISDYQVDIETGKGQISDANLAYTIKQLLVDIKTVDDAEFAVWSEKNQAFDSTKLHTRLMRFTDAFSLIFPTKRLKLVDTVSNPKRVIFEEFGREIPIENLSSGEMQIVFRGGFYSEIRTA